MEKIKSYKILAYIILSLLGLLLVYSFYGLSSIEDLNAASFDLYRKYDNMTIFSLLALCLYTLILKALDHKILKAKSMPLVFTYFLPFLYTVSLVFLGLKPSWTVFFIVPIIIQLLGLYLYIKYNDLVFEKDEIKNYKLAKNSFLLEVLLFLGIYLIVYFMKKDMFIYSLLLIFIYSGGAFYYYKKKESTMLDKLIGNKILVPTLVINNILIRQGLKVFTIAFGIMTVGYFVYRYIKTKNLEI